MIFAWPHRYLYWGEFSNMGMVVITADAGGSIL
jgi:hypothetical protein